MRETELILHFPYGRPLKNSKKEELTSELISAFKSVGVSDVKLKDSFYESKRAAPEIVAWVIRVIAVTADIITIAIAIRNFLVKRKDVKEIRLKTNSLQLAVSGRMSDEEIIKLVQEAGKIIGKEKEG